MTHISVVTETKRADVTVVHGSCKSREAIVSRAPIKLAPGGESGSGRHCRR
jgi:hypothetical protein